MWSPEHLCSRTTEKTLAAPTLEAPLAKLTYRVITLLLAALAVLGQATYADALYWNVLGIGHHMVVGGTQPALLSAVITSAVISVAAAVLAVIVAFRGDAERGARPLGLALSVWSYILSYSGLVVLLAPEPTSLWYVPFEAHFLVVEAVGLAALVRFTSLFPGALSAEDMQDPATLPAGFALGQRFRGWLLRPEAPWIGAAVALAVIFAANAAAGRTVQDAALLTVADVFRLAALTVVVLNLRLAFLVSGPEGRARMHWIVAGFAMLVGTVGLILGGNVLVAVTQWAWPPLNWRPILLDVGVLGLLWGMGMSLFYQGRRDGAALIRRVAVLSTLSTASLLLAAGLEASLSGAVSARIALPRGTGTLLAAVAFVATWVRLRQVLDSFLEERWAEVAPSYAGPDDAARTAGAEGA